MLRINFRDKIWVTVLTLFLLVCGNAQANSLSAKRKGKVSNKIGKYTARYYLRKGKNYFWNERYNKAVGCLKKGVRLDPENRSIEIFLYFSQQHCDSEAYKRYRSTKRLVEEGKLQQAIEEFEKIIKQCSNSEWVDDVIYQIGNVHTALKNYKESLKCFERVLSEFPQSELIPYVLFKKGDINVRELQRLHSKMPPFCSLPSQESYTVKYFRGVSHPFHGILVQGHSYGADPHTPPSDGKFYHEFYFDGGERLVFVVAHPPDGERYVTSRILYEHGKPFARLTYNRNGLAFGNYLYYHRAEPFLSCRILKSGKAVRIKVLGDKKAKVREIAPEALEEVTGKNFGEDPEK